MARKIPSILETEKVVDDPKYTNSNRITLASDDNTGAVRLGWDGNKKQWVVTAYEGLPYSSVPSATTKIDNSALLRGSSVQEPSGATVDSTIPQNRQDVNVSSEFAISFIHNNGNIRYLSTMLGHRSVPTTIIYTHIVDNDLERQYREFHTI